MSCFVVSKEHIDALVAARTIVARKAHANLLSELSDDHLGWMLWRENMASMASRYHDEPIDETLLSSYRFDPRTPPHVLAILKLISGYEYQSCEHREWKASRAYAFCQDLRKMLIRCMPGWDDAPWTI